MQTLTNGVRPEMRLPDSISSNHNYSLQVIYHLSDNYPTFSTENNNSFRCSLGWDTSCGCSVIYHQKMIADAAGIPLPVGGGDAGFRADI